MNNAEQAKLDGCSEELVQGIRAYDERVAALGGYGALISVAMPDGVTRTGRLIELGVGGCQPGIECEGKRYGIRLDRVIG